MIIIIMAAMLTAAGAHGLPVTAFDNAY